MRIAVAGATGYIGGRLVPRLLADGHDVVCLARNPSKLDDRPWRDDVDVKLCDVTNRDQVFAACAAVERFGADGVRPLDIARGLGNR